MKSYFFMMLGMLGFIGNLYAQGGENNIWMFGRNYSLDFNHNPPLLRDNIYLNGAPSGGSPTGMSNNEHFYDYAQAVCDADGDMLFMVKKHVYRNTGLGYSVPAPNLFDRDEVAIPGTEFLSPSDMQEDRPMIIRHPGNPARYFIFYIRNGGLVYCLFDTSLNAGKGDIVPGFKNVLHYGYNSVVGRSMTSIQGCDGVWLVLRHKTQNQFLSFKIDINGLASSPVISQAGLMQVSEYAFLNEFVVSPDGKTIALVKAMVEHLNQPGGIELFDVEKCSGKIKNARLLETGQLVYGVGFSPDNTKLYVVYSEYNPLLTPLASWWRDQNLYQFDLSLPSPAAVAGSKTLIFTNPFVQQDLPFCPLTTAFPGSMRIGKDGKLYFTNGSPAVCPGTSGVGMAIHVINNPNLAGLACNPNLNAIFNTVNGMTTGNRASSKTDFPYPLVYAPLSTPDSVSREPVYVSVCFKSDTILKAPEQATCILWSTGAEEQTTTVSQTGRYWVRYFVDCVVYTDTFDVKFNQLPDIPLVQYGCPGYIALMAGKRDGERFGLALYNSFGGKIYEHTDTNIHEVYNLEPGPYNLIITVGGNCTTALEVELKSYPLPDVTITPAAINVKYGEEVVLNADGALNYTWTPTSSLNIRTSSQVVARPETDTKYSVEGINEYGCRDTAYAAVTVDYNNKLQMPNAFTPNGDGLNDLYRVPGGRYTILRFEIYNRYGQVVYYGDSNNTGWDGTFNGKACDAGVYYYIVSVGFPDGTNTTLKGDISLIR